MAIFSFLFLLITLIPTVIILFVIVYVFKKSTEKKSPEYISNERKDIAQKVTALSKEIANWEQYQLSGITNNIDNTWIKSITRKFTGHILTMNNVPLIAFQRIERGITNDVKIYAKSTAFDIWYELNGTTLTIKFDGDNLGQMNISNGIIRDSQNIIIGKAPREMNDENKYALTINKIHIANIYKSMDMRSWERNVFHRISRHDGPNNPKYIMTGNKPVYELVEQLQELDTEQTKWVLCIAIFESIYQSLDFTEG